MKINHLNQASALYLRLAISLAYLWEVSDRLGLLGKPGSPHVGWGDWQHFMAYARQVMSFLLLGWVEPCAIIATAAEGIIGLLLLFGLVTRFAAIGSACLSFCFAIAMAVSFGIESPLGYSVFALSAASLLLVGQPISIVSADHLLQRSKTDRNMRSKETRSLTSRKKLTCLLFLLTAHTCHSFGYVLQGEIESVFKNKRHLYKQRDSFYEQPYGLHSVPRNHDPINPAKLLVFFIAHLHQPNTIHLKN